MYTLYVLVYYNIHANHTSSSFDNTYTLDQREYFQIKIDVSPTQESHEIGSHVALNCGVAYSPQKYENFTFPLTYRWYSPDVLIPFFLRYHKIQRITISSYQQSLIDYYCFIYHRDLLLGVGKTTLSVKG